MMRPRLLPSLVCLGSLALASCDEEKLAPVKPVESSKPTSATSAPASASAAPAKALPPMPSAAPLAPTPQPLPEPKLPAEGEITAEKASLGKQLFFDKRLSKDGSASCETCHVPEKGWTDGKALSTKVDGK